MRWDQQYQQLHLLLYQPHRGDEPSKIRPKKIENIDFKSKHQKNKDETINYQNIKTKHFDLKMSKPLRHLFLVYHIVYKIYLIY